MSIFEPDKIDAIGIVNHNLELLIIDTMTWEFEEEHFEMLQDKLNNYLLYLDNKQYRPKYKEGFKDIIISIHFMYDLIEDAVRFFNVVSKQLAEAGYILHIHLPDDEK